MLFAGLSLSRPENFAAAKAKKLIITSSGYSPNAAFLFKHGNCKRQSVTILKNEIIFLKFIEKFIIIFQCERITIEKGKDL